VAAGQRPAEPAIGDMVDLAACAGSAFSATRGNATIHDFTAAPLPTGGTAR